MTAAPKISELSLRELRNLTRGAISNTSPRARASTINHARRILTLRTKANKAAANGFEALADMVSARMPIFIIEQGVVEASELLKENALSELRLIECVVEAE